MRRNRIALPGFRLEAVGPILLIRIFGLTIERVGPVAAIGGKSFILPGARRA